MTRVTCRLTAKNRDQLRNPTLGNRVSATFTFYQTTKTGRLIRRAGRRCRGAGAESQYAGGCAQRRSDAGGRRARPRASLLLSAGGQRGLGPVGHAARRRRHSLGRHRARHLDRRRQTAHEAGCLRCEHSPLSVCLFVCLFVGLLINQSQSVSRSVCMHG